MANSAWINFEIKGIKELMEQMKGYPEKLKKKALEPALIEITEKIRDKAKQNILKDCAEYADKHKKKDGTTKSRATGELAKHIIAVPKTKKIGDHIIARSVITRRGRKISVKSAAKQFVGVSKNGTLIYTGNLKGKHIRLTTSKKRVKISAYYAHMIEYGKKGFKARPYMRPASNAIAPQIPEIFAKHIKAVEKELNSQIK